MNNTNTKDDFKTRLLECFEKGSVNNNESVKQTLGSIMEETACKSNRIREQECKQDEYWNLIIDKEVRKRLTANKEYQIFSVYYETAKEMYRGKFHEQTRKLLIDS